MTFGPESAPRDSADTRRWQRWVEDELKLLRSSRGVLERGSVAGGVVTVREILTDPTAPIQFLNTDTGTCPSDGADIPIVLTHVPKAGSEQVFYNGTPLKRTDWTRTDTLLVIPGETWFRSGKVAWIDYAYDGTLASIGPVITSPTAGSSTTVLRPAISGTGAAGYPITVMVDGVTIGTATVAAGGTWSITPGSDLAVGSHVVTAVQTSPDHTTLAASPVPFTVVLVPAAAGAVTTLSGTFTSIALPGVSVAGDMLVLVMRGRDAATCSDPRMTPKYLDGGGKWGHWVGTDDGSGTPLAINLSGASGSDDACAALMRISGSPLLPVTAEASTSGSGATFTPTMPAAGAFGVITITSGTGLVAASISDEALHNWTTQARIRGNGPGFASVYIGTAAGVPAGQWSNAGGSPAYTAWAGGIQ